jgi:hypothetical protein
MKMVLELPWGMLAIVEWERRTFQATACVSEPVVVNRRMPKT